MNSVFHLWIEPHFFVRLSNNSQCLHEHVNASCFSGSARPEHHDSVTNSLSLVQLDQLNCPRRMIDKIGFFDLLRDGCLQIWISDLLQRQVREEIVDEREEEGLILESISSTNFYDD